MEQKWVLVVEDDQAVYRLMEIILKDMGYRPSYADGGEKGLEVYKDSPEIWSLVILDLVMPQKNGLEVLSEIQKVNEKQKVLLLSGMVEEESLQYLLNKHKEKLDFLAKPFEDDDLKRKLSSILG